MNPRLENMQRSLSEAARKGSEVLDKSLRESNRLVQKAEGPSRKVVAAARRAGKVMGEEMARAGSEGKRVRLMSHVRTGQEAINEFRKTGANRAPIIAQAGKKIFSAPVKQKAKEGAQFVGAVIAADAVSDHYGKASDRVKSEYEKLRRKANRPKTQKKVSLSKQANSETKSEAKKRIDAEHAAGILGSAYFGQGIASRAHGMMSNDFGWKMESASPGLFNKGTKGLGKIKGKQWPFVVAGAAAGAYTGHRLSEKYRRSQRAKTQPRNPDGSFAPTT